MSGHDDAAMAIACAVTGCGRPVVGYVDAPGRGAKVEVFVGRPLLPRHVPVCARHLSVEAVKGRAPLTPWRVVAGQA